MDISNLYVVEYSKDQDAWHVDTFDRSLLSNLKMLARGMFNGYVIYGVAHNLDEAHKLCKRLQTLYDRGQQQKNFNDILKML